MSAWTPEQKKRAPTICFILIAYGYGCLVVVGAYLIGLISFAFSLSDISPPSSPNQIAQLTLEVSQSAYIVFVGGWLLAMMKMEQKISIKNLCLFVLFISSLWLLTKNCIDLDPTILISLGGFIAGIIIYRCMVLERKIAN